MLTEAVEVYRSRRRTECEERAFVLTAVGVPNEMVRETAGYLLRVDPLWAEQALAHLQRYQEEKRSTPLAVAPPRARLHSWAWVGCAGYAAALIGSAYAVSAGLGRLDAFDAGELAAVRVRAGEWWRAVTALTLHLDAAHLLTNLGAGVWFGYLCGRLLGAGHAWALILLGASTANLCEALLAPPDYHAVGASTAVFTALGLLAVYSWQERRRYHQHWALRLSPLVAGIVMLGWTGTAGEHTDVVAHLGGFVVGGVLAVLASTHAGAALLMRLRQWMTGAFAVGLLVLAWACALRS